MSSDMQLVLSAIILIGVLYGSLAGVYMTHGEEEEKQPASLKKKIVLYALFPFTLAALGSAKLMVWVLDKKRETEDAHTRHRSSFIHSVPSRSRRATGE